LLYETYEDDTTICENLKPPTIIYEVMNRPGLMGYYDGDETIHVNKELKGRDRLATTIHEMVHYLDVKWGGLPLPGPAEMVCHSEDKAWFIEGVWWGVQGLHEKARHDWWKSYPYCWPYYAPVSGFFLTWQEWVSIMGIGDEYILVVPE
jgi:hypothetical protein